MMADVRALVVIQIDSPWVYLAYIFMLADMA